MEAKKEMYQTTNSDYGFCYDQGRPFCDSFTRSTPYKTLTNRRAVRPDQLPKDGSQMALVHNPEHPCGIMTMSNLPMNVPLGEHRGMFTNVRRDLYSDDQGLWLNSAHNTPGATIDRKVGTYSNLQGAWSRIGPSTYDACHGRADWVPKWQTQTFEPATLRSLYDHRNVNPWDNCVPIDPTPQNMPTAARP